MRLSEYSVSKVSRTSGYISPTVCAIIEALIVLCRADLDTKCEKSFSVSKWPFPVAGHITYVNALKLNVQIQYCSEARYNAFTFRMRVPHVFIMQGSEANTQCKRDRHEG